MQMNAKQSLDRSNPEHIGYEHGGLTITVLGGIRLEGLDRMRVTLKIQVEHLGLRHSLDLYNDNQVEKLVRKEEEVNPMIQLLHELKHSQDRQNGVREGSRRVKNEVTGKYGPVSDYAFRAVDTENILRNAMGVPRRDSYQGFPVPENFVHH